jgi:hypothetical protein
LIYNEFSRPLTHHLLYFGLKLHSISILIANAIIPQQLPIRP